MDSLYFVCMLIGIAWLAWWSVLKPDAIAWSPFGMLEDGADAAAGPAPAGQGWRARARPVGGAEPAEPADRPAAQPQGGAAQPWRLRGKPAAAFRRGR
jgi:hypothetical protein